jgi:hypothetical protein
MALGSSPAEVQQHSTRQQEKPPNNTAVSKSSLVGESRQKQSEHEKPYNKPPARKRNRDVGTDTAYAEDTDATVSEIPRSPCLASGHSYLIISATQEVNYILARQHALDPLYSATKLAPVLATLATHKSSLPRPTTTRTKRHPAPPPPPLPTETTETNPFALPPSALPTWHHARTSLSNPTYFYTTLLANFPSPDDPRPEPEERFAVRSLAKTLEIEQGLADLRALLLECHRKAVGGEG